MTIRGVDVSHYQNALPWSAWAGRVGVVVIQVQHGSAPEPNAALHLSNALAAGYSCIGAYHFLTPGDGIGQAARFLAALAPDYRFAALDIEQVGVTADDVLSFCAWYDAHERRPLVLYGNNLLAAIVAAHPALTKYGVWWTAYPTYPNLITDPPPGRPNTPAGLHIVAWQYGGDNSRLSPYTGAIDLSVWYEIPGAQPMAYPTITHGAKLGIHSISGHAGPDLVRKFAEAHAPLALYKRVNDAGQNAEIKHISPQTLTLTRYINPVGEWENLQDSETWDEARRNQFARESIQLIFNNANAEQLAATDYFSVLNEPSHTAVRAAAWALRALCEEATRRGVRIAVPAWSQGVPEWQDDVALVDSGLFQAMIAGGHIYESHEGPLGSDAVDSGWPSDIPGAPSGLSRMDGAGAFFFRYRFLYSLLKARGLVVPLVISEAYYGGSFGDVLDLMTRVRWVDAGVRQDSYVLAVCGFTTDPDATWQNQDYTPLLQSQQMLDYLVAERLKPNGDDDMPILFHAKALIDLALRAPDGSPATAPVASPPAQPGMAGVVRKDTLLHVYQVGVSAGPFQNRAVVTADGLNVWNAANALQRL